MASNYDSVDLDFTWDGDYIIDEKGDLQDTSDDLLRSIQNEIFTVVKSDAGDWREAFDIGAGLDDFIGEPNNRITAENIKARLYTSLRPIVNLSDLAVKITPVGIHKILIMIGLQVAATPENRAIPGTSITVTFIYDYFEKGIFVPTDQMNHFSERKI